MTAQRNMIAVKINRDFDPAITVINEATSGLWPMTGTHEVKFYKHGTATAFLTCTVGSGITSINTATSVVQMNVLAAQLASVTPGYGTLEILRTDAGSDSVAVVNVAYVNPDAAGNSSDVVEYSVFAGGIILSVKSSAESALLYTDFVNEGLTNKYFTEARVRATLLTGISFASAAAVVAADPVFVAIGKLQAQVSGKSDTAHTHVLADVVGAGSEIQKGTRALNRFAAFLNLLSQKFSIIDFVAGGAAFGDYGADHKLCAIENIPGVVKTNATGGKRLSGKLRFENLGADALRYTYQASGSQAGVMLEEAANYLNKQTQPTVAQQIVGVNVSDGAGPAGYTGNWLVYGDNSVSRSHYMPADVIASQDYWFAFLIVMNDGLAPSGMAATGSGDAYCYMAGGYPPKHPDTGASGTRITGPFAEKVYLVEGYVSVPGGGSATGQYFGLQKNVTNSARGFKRGPLNYGVGRYPPSMFDNATATPNSRDKDMVQTPAAGFTADEITFIGEFRCPSPKATLRTLFYAGIASGTESIHAYFPSGTNTLSFEVKSGGVTQFTSVSAALTAGETYKFGVSLSKRLNRLDWRLKGTGAATTGSDASRVADYAPPAFSMLEHGSSFNSGANVLQSTLAFITTDDRYHSAADLVIEVG